MSDAIDSNPLFRLLKGRASVRPDLSVHLSARDGESLPDKIRQAYLWIINNAVISPYYDIQYGAQASLSGPAGDELELPGEMSYSSFVLIPMLTLFTCRRALLVGGPGRGKTTSAILMALLAGMSKDEVRRSILRGHPQLTVSDMLGSPLPSDMMKAEDLADIKVFWRQWIDKRVKVIDEYNRIPTKTQSALLSLLAEGYAEMFDQYVYAGRSSWFLTANDDSGGGTFQVIDALKDRIDVVVRAIPFNSGFIQKLVERIEADHQPEDLVPTEIVFTESELAAIYQTILKVTIPASVLERLAFFLGQLDFCRQASPQFEHKNKDTLRLAGLSVGSVCNEQCPLDKRVHLCTQTENGISARTYQTCIHFAKAMAYFRGHDTVAMEDVRQIVPYVLHDKLTPNTRSPFFDSPRTKLLLQDRIAWIRTMIDMSQLQFDKHVPLRKLVNEERARMDAGLSGVGLPEVEKRIAHVTALMDRLMKTAELSGPVYEDLILLKSIYSRYRNYEQWLKQNVAS